MLRLSKLADYGIVIMHCLGTQPEKVLSATDVAQQVHLAIPTVSKLLKLLSEAKLVRSIRGSTGGYQIAKSAKEISIAELITAVEGQPALTECAQEGEICSQNAVCAVKHNWRIINQFVMRTLGGITLDDMSRPLGVLS